MVVVLTMIPYIGIIICWVPSVLIAAFQWGDWTHPIIVTAIFIVITESGRASFTRHGLSKTTLAYIQ